MIAALLLLAAAPAPNLQPPNAQMRRAISAAVGDKLMDGESARYRWPKEDRDGVGYCGFVNAKNSFGAYTGFRPFFINGAHRDGAKGDGSYMVISADLAGEAGSSASRLVDKMCASIGADIADIPPEDSPPAVPVRRKRRP